MREMAAAAQLHSADVRQALQQRSFAPLRHNLIALAANHQHRLTNAGQDRPQIDLVENKCAVRHGACEWRAGRFQKVTEEFRPVLRLWTEIMLPYQSPKWQETHGPRQVKSQLRKQNFGPGKPSAGKPPRENAAWYALGASMHGGQRDGRAKGRSQDVALRYAETIEKCERIVHKVGVRNAGKSRSVAGTRPLIVCDAAKMLCQN